jgi:hypothetical protein
MGTPREPAQDISWQQRNSAYLAISLRWLRLRCRRLLDLHEGRARPAEARRELSSVAASRAAAARSASPPALVGLARQFDLSSFERDTLLLAAAVNLDSSFSALIRQLQGVEGGAPTAALALQLLANARWGAFAPSAALRRERLIEFASLGPNRPFVSTPMRVREDIEIRLKGL